MTQKIWLITGVSRGLGKRSRKLSSIAEMLLSAHRGPETSNSQMTQETFTFLGSKYQTGSRRSRP